MLCRRESHFLYPNQAASDLTFSLCNMHGVICKVKRKATSVKDMLRDNLRDQMQVAWLEVFRAFMDQAEVADGMGHCERCRIG